MMIGISVSSCILAMALGAVSPANVTKIIGATSARTPEEWDEVIERYKFLFFLWGCFWAISVEGWPVVALCLVAMLVQFCSAWKRAL